MMVFVLSAVSPKLFSDFLSESLKKLRVGGMVFFRDYGLYDLPMLRFKRHNHLSGRTFKRSDGTLSTFFTVEQIDEMFIAQNLSPSKSNGFACVENVNRKTGASLKRVFVSASFTKKE